jgi:transcriptional regulator with XRE-family HTH domain
VSLRHRREVIDCPLAKLLRRGLKDRILSLCTLGASRSISKLNVLLIFGENLRLLCAERGSQAQVARDLGLSKVQLQRYLRSESFPKPNLMKRVCAYFQTDARMLIEPLAELRRGNDAERDKQTDMAEALQQAFCYVGISPRVFDANDAISDGDYLFWRNSMSQTGKIARSVVRLKTIGKSRVVRGFDPIASLGPSVSVWPGKVREYRGILMRQTTGFSTLLFHGPPTWALSHIYLAPLPLILGPEAYYGFTTLGREEFPQRARMGRVIWQKLQPGFRPLMHATRNAALLDPCEVSEEIRSIIMAPLA